MFALDNVHIFYGGLLVIVLVVGVILSRVNRLTGVMMTQHIYLLFVGLIVVVGFFFAMNFIYKFAYIVEKVFMCIKHRLLIMQVCDTLKDVHKRKAGFTGTEMVNEDEA